MADVQDSWAAAASYEEFMGRWSRLLARRFVAWLQVAGGAHWLDTGCGTGALTTAVCENAEPATVTGCDPAQAFIEYARHACTDGRASFVVADVTSLPHRPDGFDSAASLLALNFFPEPQSAIRDMRSRVVRQGTVSACVWDYGDGMGFLRRFWDAATRLDRAAEALDEGNRFPLCRPPALTELFRSAGLDDVRCEPLDIATTFTSFDDYWRPFLGATGPAPSYVASLDDERRVRLAGLISDTLPRELDGSITLTARAWAVRGTVA